MVESIPIDLLKISISFFNCLGGGCPVNKQPWCCDVPATHSWQMIVGFMLIFTGVALGNMMGSVIFSKILGPYPQVKLRLKKKRFLFNSINFISQL